MSDPFFPDKPLIPAPEGHPSHEKRPESDKDWVVVHRGGEGSKAHVEALERKLIKAHIPTRIEHNDDHKIVLEVHRDREAEAVEVLGEENVSGRGSAAHQTREQRIEAEERGELTGAFKASSYAWLLVVVAVALLGYLVYVFVH
jgi:hypothetical protein